MQKIIFTTTNRLYRFCFSGYYMDCINYNPYFENRIIQGTKKMKSQMNHKKVNKYVLYGAIVSLNLLLSCGSSNNQDLYHSTSDTLGRKIEDCDLDDTAQAHLPYLMPIDSLWAYYDANCTTSGRCNRPDIFDDDSSKNLSYGFYTVLDSRLSSMPPIVADIIVSYRKNKPWRSSDTTQKIRVIHVKDRLFLLPIASFHVGDHVCCIKDKSACKTENYYCFSDEKYCYVVVSHYDTIQHFFVFSPDLACDWTRILKFVKTQ